MKFLQNIKVSTNLWLILIVAAIGLMFVSGVSLFSLRQALSQERHEKIKQLVDVPYGILTFFQAQEGSGKLTKDQAQAQAIAAIKALRYDKDGYFWINDFHPKIIMHPIKPELDGKDVSDLKDPAGTFLFVEFAKVAQKSGEGFVPYLWPKPGFQTPVEKISYVKGFQPWGWVIGSGVYIDDLDAVFWRKAAASLTTIIIGVVVLLIMAVATMRAVLGKLGGEPDYAASVVREISGGNLSVNVKLKPGDSTSLLAGMKSMRDRLNQTMVEVRASIDELAQWSTQLQQAVGNVTQNSKRQNDSAYTVASSVQEMSASINDISQRSQQASTLVENAYSLSERGHSVVINASKEMGNIAGKMAQSSNAVQALGKQSQEISSIVNVIKGIADQTNLLALNASIEAARAGEQGRGFAVVADEVRKLAERTAQSTDEISKMVEGIQSGTMNAVQSMESVNASIESGVSLASQAAGSIEEIKDSSRGISTVVSEISHALKEQREANSSIANSIEQIAHMSEQNMNTVQETASSAHRLENLAKNLRTSVSHFQV